MLGRRSRQITLADVDGWQDRIPVKSVWYRMRAWSEAHLNDDAFAGWFATNGRPSVPPSYMVTLLLLQVRQGWSDRDAVEAAMFDDRVKYALGTGRMPEVRCDHTTLVHYRTRFLDTGLGRQLLSETLHEAADAGLLGNDEDLVDSFPIVGAAARQSTHVLIYRAIGRVLVEVQEAGVTPPALVRQDYGQHRKPAIAWREDAQRQVLLEELVADGRALVAFFPKDEEGKVPAALRSAVDLLALVVEQDITTDAEGRVVIAHKTAPDRILSIVDPQMRHGRKTSSQKFNGYKGHVLVQNGAPDGAHMVTAAVASAANVGDGEMLAALLMEREALTGAMPQQVQGDTAYGSMAVRDQAAEVAPETKVEAPVPPSNGVGGRFAKTAFAIDTEARTVTCPEGNTIGYQAKATIPAHKTTQQVHFPAAMCTACPLRERCVGGKGGRSVTIQAEEARIQKERERQATPEWQSHYRERSRVEHANQRLCRHGARQAHGLGEAKVGLQLQMASVVANIEEMARVTGGTPPGRQTFRPQCPQVAA